MLHKCLANYVGITLLVSSFSMASSQYIPNLNDEVSYNNKEIKSYKNYIEKLEKRNAYLTKIKNKNPNLYTKKSLYEDTKNEYIYRVKLEGAKAKNMNFIISNHRASIEMYLKKEIKESNSYYASSQSYYQQFMIPNDVEESKITHKINGDYFEVIMPKKK